MQSPGLVILKDPDRHDELKDYVTGVIGRFRADRRVHAWDLFNEPENPNRSSYGRFEPANKPELALALLKKEFAWARSADPRQPLTAGVWIGDLTSRDRLTPINRFMLEQSDVISFHNYKPLPEMKRDVESLKRYGRPLLCTEYMARPAGSTFDPILAYLKSENVGGVQLGLRRRQDPDDLSLGLVEEAVRRRAPGLVPRHLPRRRHAVQPQEVEYIRGVTTSRAAGWIKCQPL